MALENGKVVRDTGMGIDSTVGVEEGSKTVSKLGWDFSDSWVPVGASDEELGRRPVRIWYTSHHDFGDKVSLKSSTGGVDIRAAWRVG